MNRLNRLTETDVLLDSHLLDTSRWREMVDVTLTLKQGCKAHDGITSVLIDQYQCTQAFKRFMALLNKAVYGNAVIRFGKRINVIPVKEKSAFGRWHYHCAMEIPDRLDPI